ncbi:MAG: hypothetical protein Q4P66_09080 [Actinomycetaceae bacterium]|nr:hypothetical protein [Actinomycetaceae bacterium]
MKTTTRLSRPIAIIATITMIIGLMFAGLITSFANDVTGSEDFTNIYTSQHKGELIIAGNTQMTCDRMHSKTAITCKKILKGDKKKSNNDIRAIPVDVDNDPGTVSSSKASLTLPDGAKVVQAFLFWGAAVKKGLYNGENASGQYDASGIVNFSAPKNIKFKHNDDPYAQIIPSKVYQFEKDNYDYSAYADVTDYVKGKGSGDYWAADFPMATGRDRYAGWSLVVVTADPNMPFRDLNVFAGYKRVKQNDRVDIKISPFVAPPTGEVKARIGTITYEGDVSYGGDQLIFNSKQLHDGLNTADNYFNSTISTDGNLNEGKNPDYTNNLGFDAKISSANGYINNGDTSATATFTSAQETYYPTMLGTQIDLYVPEFDGAGIKNVTNLNGNTPARVGDQLEYAITVHNTGDDAADKFVLTDKLDPKLAYVPGSLKVDGVVQSDKTADDLAEFDTGTITARMGKGASNTEGGTVDPDARYQITYRAKVLDTAAGKSVNNKAVFNYVQHTLGQNGSNETNETETPVAPIADVKLTKTGPTSLNAGEKASWTLKASNAGPNPAENVVVSDDIPVSVTDISVTPADKCTLTGQKIKCELGNLGVGDSAAQELTVSGTVKTDEPAGNLVNVAKISTTTSQGSDSGQNTATATTPIRRSADIELESKTVEPESSRPGESQTWTIKVTNNGPSTAEDVIVTDTIPDAFEIVGRPTGPAGSTCEVNDQDVTCHLHTMDKGASATITVKTKLDPAHNKTTVLKNNAMVSSDTKDPFVNNKKSATFKPQESQSSLTIDKKSTDDKVYAGKKAHYSVTIGNKGPSVARGVTVTDTLPNGMVPKIASVPGGTCKVNDQTVLCDIGEVAVGESIVATYEVDVASSVKGNVVNTATVHADNDPSDASDQATVDVIPDADLMMKKKAPAQPVTAGNDTSYTLEVVNKGTADATGVKVSDTIPAELEYKAVAIDPAEGTCDYDTATKTVNCDLKNIPNGNTVKITIDVHVPQNVEPEEIHNTATVTSDKDPNPDNNKATASFSTNESADLSIKKTTDATQAVAGKTIAWKLVVTNNGPSDADDVVIEDTLPNTILPGEANIKAEPSDKDKDVTCKVEGRKLTCTKAASLSATDGKNSITIDVTANIDPATKAMSIDNTAAVHSTTTDPTPVNEDNVSTPLSRAADLETNKEKVPADPETVIAGEKTTWKITTVNHGPSVATDVKLSDVLPKGYTFVKAPGSDCLSEGSVVTCSLGDIVPGKDNNKSVTITAKLAASAQPGTKVTNTAKSSSEKVPDLNNANNIGRKTSTVKAKDDLRIVKSVTPQPLVSGADATYKVKVTNNGPSWARNVTVTDTLPAGITPISAQSTGTCEVKDHTVTCTFDSVAVGDKNGVAISIPVTVEALADVSNTAKVTSDATPDGVSDTIKTPISFVADLQASKTANLSTVKAGNGMTWTLSVVNAGPSRAKDVVLRDTLSAHTEFVSAGKGCAYDDKTRVVTCEVGELANGEVAERDIVVKTDAAMTDTELSNTVNVSQSLDTTDPNADNNKATSTVTVERYSELELVKKADTNPVEAGRDAQWSIIATNHGPSVADNVVVTDNLPDSLTPVSATAKDGTCTIEGQKVTCSYPTMPLNVPKTITLKTAVASDIVGKTVKNTAHVVAGSPFNENPHTGNVPTETTVPIIRHANMSVVKSMAPKTPVPGENITYTLTAANAGPAKATNVTITDVLPGGLSDVTVTTSHGTCNITEATPATEDTPASSGTITCKDEAGLSVGELTTVTVKAVIDPAATGSLSNTASVESGVTDLKLDDNSATVSGTLTPKSDVSISKKLIGKAVAGENVEWQLVVSNVGPSVARDVTVADMVSTDVTDLKVSRDDKGTCTVGKDNKVECVVGDLAPNKAVVITVKGKLSQDFMGSLDNQAIATTTTEDTDLTNNSVSANSDSLQSADLSITKSLQGQAVSGKDVTWNLVVSNAGPSVAREVKLTDSVDAHVSGLQVTRDDKGQCIVGQANTVTCDIAALASGSSLTVTLKGRLSEGFTGKLSNTASVSSVTADPNEENNTATTAVDSVQSADVALVKKLLTKKVVAGKPVEWTLTATNNGPSDAQQVSITDNVANVVTGLTAVRDDGGTCTIDTNNHVACDIDTIKVGDSVTVTLSGTLSEDFSGELENNADVTSQTTDPDQSNNASLAKVSSAQEADLSVVKTMSGNAVAGKRVTWDVVASNAGPSVARNVVLSDTMPAGVTDVKVSKEMKDKCVVDKSQHVTCTIDTLVSGKTFTVTLSALLTSDYQGDLKNTARVTSDTPDPSPENSVTEISSLTEQSANLSIVKKADTAIVAGKKGKWTLEVTNDGPSVARNVTITDMLPEGVSNVVGSSKSDVRCTTDDNAQLTCTLDQIDVDQSIVINVSADVAVDFTGELTNTASVRAETPDLDLSDNTSAVLSQTTQEADIALTKTVDKTEVASGQPLTWTLNVVNNGPSEVKNVVVSDTLPAGTQLDGHVIVPNDVTCSVANSVLSCTIAKLGVNNPIDIRIPASIATEKDLMVTNSAMVQAPGITDFDSSNNMSQARIAVSAPKPAPQPDPSEEPSGDPTEEPSEEPSSDVDTDKNKGKIPNKHVQHKTPKLSKTGSNAYLAPSAAVLALLGFALVLMGRRRDNDEA